MDTFVGALMRILKLLEPPEPSKNYSGRFLCFQLSTVRKKSLSETPVARHGPIMGHNEAYDLQEAF